MQIPRSIIHDAVKLYSGTSHFDEACAAGYTDVEFLPEDMDAMRADILYVCGLSAALQRAKKCPGYSYACIRDCFWTEEEDDLLPGSGAIIINENRSVSWLLSLIQHRMREVREWVYRLQSALLSGGGYQELMDCSEDILGNSVYVLDASYALLAYTKNIINTEPVITSLIAQGSHSEETMAKFKESHRFGVYQRTDGIIVSAPSTISNHEVISKWCRYQGEPLIHVVMVCEHIPLNNAITDLFAILMQYIETYFSHQQTQLSALPQRYTAFLLDILYNGLEDRNVINDRANVLGIPRAGHFDVFRLTFCDNSIVLVGRVVKELMGVLPKSWIVSHNNEITILNEYGDTGSGHSSAEHIRRLDALLEKYNAICGISSAFSKLSDLRIAARQAATASSIGQSIYALGNFWNFDAGVWAELSRRRDKKVFVYDRVNVYHMLLLAHKEMPEVSENTYCNRALAELMRTDRERDSKLTQILFAYLTAESSATGASKLLNMHRNNVVYHISKIEEQLELDLSDFRVRQDLMLAFLSMELKAAVNAGLLGLGCFLPTIKA